MSRTNLNLAQWLNGLGIEDIYRIVSEIDSYDGRFTLGDAGSCPMPTEEMLDLIQCCDMSVADIINMVRHGDADLNEDWLGLDGYGNFQSYTDAEARERFLDEADEIIDGIREGYSDYANDLLEDAGLVDEDEDEEEDD